METNTSISLRDSSLPIIRALAKLPFARQVVALGYAVRDPSVPIAKKIGVAAAIGYIVLPFDLIPDFLPGVGAVDDIAAGVLAVKLAGSMITDEHLQQADDLLRDRSLS